MSALSDSNLIVTVVILMIGFSLQAFVALCIINQTVLSEADSLANSFSFCITPVLQRGWEGSVSHPGVLLEKKGISC